MTEPTPAPVKNVLLNFRQVNGVEVITEWPMDAHERYCVGVPGEAESVNASGLVINPDSGNCNPHWPADDPCAYAERIPPECQHAPNRLDPGALKEAPRCLDCGLVGRDVTADWRRRSAVVTPAPSGDDPVMH